MANNKDLFSLNAPQRFLWVNSIHQCYQWQKQTLAHFTSYTESLNQLLLILQKKLIKIKSYFYYEVENLWDTTFGGNCKYYIWLTFYFKLSIIYKNIYNMAFIKFNRIYLLVVHGKAECRTKTHG